MAFQCSHWARTMVIVVQCNQVQPEPAVMTLSGLELQDEFKFIVLVLVVGFRRYLLLLRCDAIFLSRERWRKTKRRCFVVAKVMRWRQYTRCRGIAAYRPCPQPTMATSAPSSRQRLRYLQLSYSTGSSSSPCLILRRPPTEVWVVWNCGRRARRVRPR